MPKLNIQLFLAGVFMLIIGYVLLSIGPANGFLSLTLAPVILVIAYCVIIPIAIMYRSKNKSN